MVIINVCLPGLIETQQKIVISLLNIPLSVTAFLGNVLIIAALLKTSSLHPPSKVSLGCLACTDLCVGLITQPLFVTRYFLSSQGCYFAQMLLYSIGTIFCGVSLKTLTAISVDRLLALLLRLRYRQVVTLRKVLAAAITFWLYNITIAVIVFYNNRIAPTIVFLEVILCTVISTFCYTRIYLRLRHHQAQVQDHGHQGREPNGGGTTLNMARYRKTVSSAIWVQMTLLACYLPYGITSAILVARGSFTQSLAFASAATFSLLLLNSSLNPLLYCWKMREVRQAVKDTMRQFFSS